MSHDQNINIHPIPFCHSCYNPMPPMPPEQQERNPHKRDCPNQSPEQMLAVIKTQMTESVWRNELFVRTHHQAGFWQAKFHTLRLENNGLRRRLRKQAAPEPQWHNPENVDPGCLGEGFRFLTKEETILPCDADFHVGDVGGVHDTRFWFCSSTPGQRRQESMTYRTRTPLPKP